MHHVFPTDCDCADADAARLGNLLGTSSEAAVVTSEGTRTLRPPKLARPAKQLAQALVLACVRERAGATADAAWVARIASELRPQAAMVCWAHELLQRLTGETIGPAALALWRMFAWSPSGSPRPGFAISADAILDAERELAAALAPRSAATTATLAEFVAEIYAHPDDDSPRHVLADALLALDDPRGELIALQLAAPDEPPDRLTALPGAGPDQAMTGTAAFDQLRAGGSAAADRVDALLATHGTRWLGELARIGCRARFRRGFVSELALGRAPRSAIECRASEPALATVESLAGSPGIEDAYARYLTSSAMLSLRAVEVWDPLTVAALERVTAPLEHVACVTWGRVPLVHGDSVLGACAQLATLRSLTIGLELFDCLARSPLLARLASLTVVGRLDLALALWPRLPAGISLAISDRAQLGTPPSLTLARGEHGAEATIRGMFMTDRVCRGFAELPELAHIAIVDACGIDDTLGGLARDRGLELAYLRAPRATGYVPSAPRR